MLDVIWLAAGFPDEAPFYGNAVTDDMRETMLVAPEFIFG